MKFLKTPRLSMGLSMLVFGTLGIFVRNINTSSGELALYRAILATALIALFLVITKQKFNFADAKKELFLLAASGMAMGINWILLFEAYKHTTVSVATLSYYFAPVIVTVLCPIIFRERLTAKQIICFVMSTSGIVLITGTGGFSGKKDFVGILFGLSAACFYATVVLLNKFIKKIEGIQRTFIQFLSSIVILIPYVLLTSGIQITELNQKGMVNLLIVGVIHSGLAYILYFSSLKELPGQTAAILSYIDPLVAVLVSVVILKEPLGALQIVGGLLILGFTLLNEISFKRKTPFS